ncbi:MAG: hypothetical protein AAGL17_00800 [Cyanobacteria bacterium J06576_12]
MMQQNAIKHIGFPDTAEQGFEIVVGTRIDKYLSAHPTATEVDAYRIAKASLTSAATALQIDAIVDGKPCRLTGIAALPTDAQIAAGNHDLSLEFVNLEDEPAIEFDDPKISRWVEDCSAELHDAVYAYFRAQM